MLALLAATLVTYNFSATPADYDVNVVFDGYLPVFGGREGKLEVVMGVQAKAAAEPNRVEYKLTELTMRLNGAKLPFGMRNVQSFFPDATIDISATGKVLKTTAPKIKMPVRLPGLDPQRFPDLTFLPLEFPATGIEVGKPFMFKKDFGDGPVSYTVTPTEIKDDLAQLDIVFEQASVSYEDANKNPVEKADDASAKLETHLTGDGKGTFNLRRGLIATLSLKAQADGILTDIKSGAKTQRSLKTSLKTILKEQKA